MNAKLPQEIIDAVQRGPQQVIGFDRNGQRQADFVMGFNAAKEEIYRALVDARMWPVHDDPLDPDAGIEDSPCVESAARWGSEEGQHHGIIA